MGSQVVARDREELMPGLAPPPTHLSQPPPDPPLEVQFLVIPDFVGNCLICRKPVVGPLVIPDAPSRGVCFYHVPSFRRNLAIAQQLSVEELTEGVNNSDLDRTPAPAAQDVGMTTPEGTPLDPSFELVSHSTPHGRSQSTFTKPYTPSALNISEILPNPSAPDQHSLLDHAIPNASASNALDTTPGSSIEWAKCRRCDHWHDCRAAANGLSMISTAAANESQNSSDSVYLEAPLASQNYVDAASDTTGHHHPVQPSTQDQSELQVELIVWADVSSHGSRPTATNPATNPSGTPPVYQNDTSPSTPAPDYSALPVGSPLLAATPPSISNLSHPPAPTGTNVSLVTTPPVNPLPTPSTGPYPLTRRIEARRINRVWCPHCTTWLTPQSFSRHMRAAGAGHADTA